MISTHSSSLRAATRKLWSVWPGLNVMLVGISVYIVPDWEALPYHLAVMGVVTGPQGSRLRSRITVVAVLPSW